LKNNNSIQDTEKLKEKNNQLPIKEIKDRVNNKYSSHINANKPEKNPKEILIKNAKSVSNEKNAIKNSKNISKKIETNKYENKHNNNIEIKSQVIYQKKNANIQNCKNDKNNFIDSPN